MFKNANLHKAKIEKNDEFYTQLTDVSKEMMHYKQHFKDKVVFCNCDDPTWSAFWKYFHLNFSALGLKKLISTHYDKTKPTYKMEYMGGNDNDIEVGIKTLLEGNGDFRNQECLDLLDESDIVVTNPPFSLFREYVAILMEHEKSFIIIGSKGSIGYKEIFPLFRDNRMWIGTKSMSGSLWFETPEGYKGKNDKFIDGVKLTPIPCCWFTNLDIQKRHEKLILWKKYTPEEYPTYDNYDAINVDKVDQIPCDYDGVIGVPITFMNNYCPEQFEIIASSQTGCHPDSMVLKKYKDYKGYNADGTSNGRTGSTCGNNPMIAKNDGKHAYYMNDKGHTVQSTFGKLFIRKKKYA